MAVPARLFRINGFMANIIIILVITVLSILLI
jgi:hypothetical protein